MRIVAGRFRGMALASVGKGDPAAHLRPTTDRVRESLFNILTSGRLGDAVSGARVLDLFAGTGALGLEALSRGAAHVTFVETGRAALRLLEKNIAATRTGPEVTRPGHSRPWPSLRRSSSLILPMGPRQARWPSRRRMRRELSHRVH